VLLHGFIDVHHHDGGRALVVDFKTDALGEAPPAEVVEREYRIQRLVYALACLRAGAEQVEVVYQFLERPEELVTLTVTTADLATLEAELTAAITAVTEGAFTPRPSPFACAGCPALNVICAGPNLAGGLAAAS
jgi:ATP-dependent helicase/nuclease subunit A